MNFSRRKLVQKLLIVFLVFVAAISAIALFSRHIVAKKLQYLLSVIENNQPESEQAGNALLLLNQAENDFQLAVFSFNTDKLGLYKSKLQQAFSSIDSLRRQQVADSQFMQAHKQELEIKQLYRRKLQLSEQILSLKSNFDSLLIAANLFAADKTPAPPPDIFNALQRKKNEAQSNSDTIVEKSAPVVIRKKGLFKRLKDALANKPDTIHGTAVKLISNQKKYSDSITLAVMHDASNFYRRSLNELRQKQEQLSAYQTDLFAANQHIMEQLKVMVSDLKNASDQLSAHVKKIALREYRSSSAILDGTGLISLILVLVFSVLLLIYIAKINTAETIMQREHELATSLAQQKTDILAAMSHEIRNPLNSIIGFLKELKASGLTAQQAEMMNAIQLSSDMLLATVNDVLDMTKLESGRFQLYPEQFNPYNTLRLTTETMRFSAQDKQLTLHYEFTGDRQLNVTGDAFRLKQVLLNLLSNAIKFTEQGQVTVKASLQYQHNRPVLQVTVSDTGPGISKAQQARLFTKYYQASTAKGQTGTGLGLYICQKLVQLQGGTIQVNSTPGKGASFSFTIPYAAVQAEKIQQTPSLDVSTSVFAGKKILVADDNEVNLRLISIMTRNWDVHLFTAKDGKEAMDILSYEQVDIVLTDMQMAGMTGTELVTAIRQSNDWKHHLPVVLISAHIYTDEEIKQLKQTGFTDVIAKPFNETLLGQKLFAALHTAIAQPL